MLLMGALIAACVAYAGGALVYTLDDPYIHLALARAIQHGGYGINLGEWASPSSSILWPLILALPTGALNEVWPLIINVACVCLCVDLLGRVIAPSGCKPWVTTASALAIALGLNLFGLAMTGMEHSLQVLLVMYVAYRLSDGQAPDAPLYLALVAMPLIRYECLVLSLPILAYLFLFKDQKRSALLTTLALVSLLLGFSFFLHRLGLPWLPCSVIAKSSGSGPVSNFMANWNAQPAMAVMLVWLAYAHRQNLAFFSWVLLLPVIGFMLGGRSGWFGRYEVFMVAHVALFSLRAWVAGMAPDPTRPGMAGSKANSVQIGFAALALAVAFPGLLLCTLRSPLASRNIAQQQVVMAEMVRELKQPVAINDLGLVALRSGQYVLDLGGLGSYDAFKARQLSSGQAEWIQGVMAAKSIHFALIYDMWFPDRPGDWIKVGELVLPNKAVTSASDTVSLYANTPASATQLRQLIQDMAQRPRFGALMRVMPL